MIDKIINAINEIVGDGGEGDQPDQSQQGQQASSAGSGFVPDDPKAETGHDGQVGHRLDQLVSDAKKQLGDKPQ